MTSNQRNRGLFPTIDSQEAARKVAQQGVWSGGFVAVVTCLAAIAVILMGNSFPKDFPEITAWSFWDAGMFAAIAWGIHKMSRAAAVIGLVLYLIEQLYMRVSNPALAGSGIIFMILLIFGFINGVRGTFAYHRLRQSKLD